MPDLLFGVETEYAIAGMSPNGPIHPQNILRHIMEQAHRTLVHLPDLHPSGGMFLQNGSRFYIDCGLHPEISTPECGNPRDVVKYTLAGHKTLRALASAAESEIGPGTEIACFRGNVDYSGTQSTWGSHESYMHRAGPGALQPQVTPHLCTRLIYAGQGGFNQFSQGLEFTLSPRVAHIRRVVSDNSTADRGIWHTKSEPLCTGYHRLHILCGESLCSETAAFLKVGVTALIVAMADAGLTPGSAVQLKDPLSALHEVASDTDCKNESLLMADGSRRSAMEIQRHYLAEVEDHRGDSFMPPWASEVCRIWRAVLDQLGNAPTSVEQTLDWAIKLSLFSNHAESKGIRWDAVPLLNKVIKRLSVLSNASGRREGAIPLEVMIDKKPMPREIATLEPLLRSQDLSWEDLRALLDARSEFFEIDTRFGQLGSKGIFDSLDQAGVLRHRVEGVANIENAMTEPPATGRALIRGRVIQRLAGKGIARCDWQTVYDQHHGKVLDLSDAFTKEESWQPCQTPDRRRFDLEARLAEDIPAMRDQYSRRQTAADCIVSGDYQLAEELLRGLADEGFETPSTCCHLARVLLLTNREQEALAQIAMASAIRDQAPAYVLARILFFQCIFAIFDGSDMASNVTQIKALLESGAHLDWTIEPVLNNVRTRLGETNYRFLRAVARAMCDSSGMARLNRYAQWREASTSTGD